VAAAVVVELEVGFGQAAVAQAVLLLSKASHLQVQP
jgi:hypothetical protein